MTLDRRFLFGTVAGGIGCAIGAIRRTLLVLAARTAGRASARPSRSGPLPRAWRPAFGAMRLFNYLLVLRLVPLFPFFLVNLAPAFLKCFAAHLVFLPRLSE